MWKTVWQLFESPKGGIKNIIFADHKNFMIGLLFLLAIKLYFTAASIQSNFNLLIPKSEYLIYNVLIFIGIIIVTIYLYSLILRSILKKRNSVRLRDNLAIIVYSFIPFILSLFFLSPVEYGIFGKHWFIANPTPVLIKETLAYIFIVLELITVIWSAIILYRGFSIQANSKVLGFIYLMIFLTIISVEIIFIPFTLL